VLAHEVCRAFSKEGIMYQSASSSNQHKTHWITGKPMKIRYLFACLASLIFALSANALSLEAIVAGEHRSEINRARDQYRHPVETLQFMGVEPDMTVVEIWPATGWYTEVLAPYLKEQGVFYAAGFGERDGRPFIAKVRGMFAEMLEADPEHYGAVKHAVFDPGANELSVPPGTADRVLTFRNVHNWLRDDSEQQAFHLFYQALKPGGILGVVEHRSLAGIERETMLSSGYMDQNYVIELAQKAGFQLDATSEINANPLDTKNHPKGVWTLPPGLRLGAENRDHYLAIGESDRMTLRFIKPQQAEHAQ
jgi:predicted methyltransferase